MLVCVSRSYGLGPPPPHPSRPRGHQAQGGRNNEEGWEAVGSQPGTSQPGNLRQRRISEHGLWKGGCTVCKPWKKESRGSSVKSPDLMTTVRPGSQVAPFRPQLLSTAPHKPHTSVLCSGKRSPAPWRQWRAGALRKDKKWTLAEISQRGGKNRIKLFD